MHLKIAGWEGCLTTPLGQGYRVETARRISARLHIARKVILERNRARLALNAEGRDGAAGHGDVELELAERATTRDKGHAAISEDARARGVHGGEVARAEVSPRRSGELVRRGVVALDEADEVADRDEELIIKRNSASLNRSRGHLYIFRI